MVNFIHGHPDRPFVQSAEAHMPILECIKAATVNAIVLLRVSDILGSIEKGKYAGIIAVECDVAKYVHAMGKVEFVMKNGVVYKNE